jgi:hypothetical protein
MKTDLSFLCSADIASPTAFPGSRALSLCLGELEREAEEIGAILAAALIGAARLELQGRGRKYDD